MTGYTIDDQKYTYKGYWTANNSTYGYIYGNNLAKLRKDLRAVLAGNIFEGGQGAWSIAIKDLDGYDTMIADGNMRG